MIAIAFTVITGGIGLIQARFAAVTIIASNNSTKLDDFHTRLNVQSELYIPLGMFLVTLGLAMIFAIVIRFGYSLIGPGPKVGTKRLDWRRSPLVRFLGWKLTIVSSVTIAVMFAYGWYGNPRIHKMIADLYSALARHPSFVWGFSVFSFVFLIALKVVRKRMDEVRVEDLSG